MQTGSPIDFNEVSFASVDLENNDRRWTICVPAKCVQAVVARLKSDIPDVSLSKIQVFLQEKCLEHLLTFLDKPPAFPVIIDPEHADSILYADKDFEFSLLVDRVAEISFPDFSNIELHKPAGDITEQMIQEEVARHTELLGERIESNTPADVDDELSCTVSVLRSESKDVVATVEKLAFRIPKDSISLDFSSFSMPHISQLVLGASVGDTVRSSVSFSGESSAIAKGEDLEADLVITGIARVKPASVSQVCEQYGFVNEAILFQNIKFSMLQRMKDDQFEIMLKELETELIEKTNFVLPSRVIPGSSDSSGHSPVGISSTSPPEVDTSPENGERFIPDTLWRILAQSDFGADFGVSDNDVFAEISLLASKVGMRPEQLREELVKTNKLPTIKAMATRRKIAEAVFNQAIILEEA